MASSVAARPSPPCPRSSPGPRSPRAAAGGTTATRIRATGGSRVARLRVTAGATTQSATLSWCAASDAKGDDASVDGVPDAVTADAPLRVLVAGGGLV
jgi:hypothetical protein